MSPKSAALRLDPLEGHLSADDLAELRARSQSAEGALARGECFDADDVLAELDEIAARQ